MKFPAWLLLFSVLICGLFAESGAWDYSIDNSCQTCTRRHLDSLNVHDRRPIRLNQTGYRPQDSRKWAMVADPASTVFTVVNAETGQEAFSGTLFDLGEQPRGKIHVKGVFNSITGLYEFKDSTNATENLYRADFSQLSEEGRFFMTVGNDTSAVFRIDDKIYNHIFETVLKFFGVNRCGDTHSWIHGPCHLLDGSAVGKDLTGGWHDCGDHGKYSETVGYAGVVMSLTYALWPEKAEDYYGASYNDTLPFGNDGIPDILWEAKVGADYIYKLYKASKENGVFPDLYHSVGTGPGADHNYWDRPDNQDAQPASQGGPDRPVTAGIGSNVAGMYAATLAFFSWGWQLFDPDYSAELLAAAEDIYDNTIMPNLNSSTTMPCCYPGGGRTDDDEAMAALALWFATKDPAYGFDLLENPAIRVNGNPHVPGYFPGGHMGTNKYFNAGGWTTDYEQIHAFVLYGLARLILKDDATATQYGLTSAKRQEYLDDVIITLAHSIAVGSNGSTVFNGDEAHEIIKADEPYHGVFTSADWGYNRYNMGMVNNLFMYWDLTKEQIYFDLAIDNINYNMGMNPWDMSFLMGSGDKNLQHPHNRASNPDGYNAGGFPYEYTKPLGALMGGCKPDDMLIDFWEDYTVTETCIDFATTMILPAQMLAKNLPPDNSGPRFFNISVDQAGQSTAIISWQTDELSVDSIRISDDGGQTVIRTVSAGALSQSKVVMLDNLDANTDYVFSLVGMDVRRNVSVDDNHGEWYPFSTSNDALPAAQFEAVRICNVTHNQATVYWWTPNGSYHSQVNYGTTTALGESVVGDDTGLPGMFHQVTLKNLSPATTYYLDVVSGTSTDDNGGAHYSFTTTEVMVDYTIMIKPTNKNNGNAHFYIDITNNESQAYEGVELRFYYQHPQGSGVTIHGFDNQMFDVNGLTSVLTPTFGSPVDYGNDYWYIPITISDTLPVAGRARIEFQVNMNGWGDVAFSEIEDAWSISPHSEPEPWAGVDLSKASVYVGPEFVESVNGVPEVTYTQTMYITAHYNGQHVYGYPPDYETNAPVVLRNVDLNFDSPLQTPANFVEIDVDEAVFDGQAWAEPNAYLSHVERGNLDFGLAELTLNRLADDSVTFNETVSGLKYGSNNFTFVAWHNRDQSDCACKVQRLNIEVDTLAQPRETRELQFSADTVVGYQGKRTKITLQLVDENGSLITDEDLTYDLNASDIGVKFYFDKETTVDMRSVTLENGVAEFYVWSENPVIAKITLSASNPLPDYRYLPGIVYADIQERPPWPIIDEAVVEDSDCDMIPDRIVLLLTESFKSGQTPLRLELNYQGGIEVPLSSSNLEDSVLIANLPAGLQMDGAPSGEVTLFMSISGTEESHSEEFEDGIGPQVIGISLLEQLDPDQTRDTIFVQFSEKIKAPGIIWPFYNFDTDGSAISAEPDVVNVAEYDAEKNIWMFVVKSASDSMAQPIAENAEVQLKEAENAPILDIIGNTQAACDFNRLKVKIKYRPFPMKFGEIFDGDGDGQADSVWVEFSRPLDDNHTPDSISIAFGTYAPETLTVESFALSSDKKMAFIKLDPQFAIGNTNGEFQGDYQGSSIRDGGLAMQHLGEAASYERQETVIADQVGPVLLRAVLSPGSLLDTLLVDFSEPVKVLDSSSLDLLLRVRNDEIPLLPLFWKVSNADSMQAEFWYSEDDQGAMKVGDKVKLSGFQSVFIDQRLNEPSPDNPPVVVRGKKSFDIKTSFDLVQSVVSLPLSEIEAAYGNHVPAKDEHFRVTVVNQKLAQEFLIRDGVFVDSLDTADLHHPGPLWEIRMAVPTGAGDANRQIWDSLEVQLNFRVFDQLGQFTNSVAERVVLRNTDFLTLGDEVVFYVEWVLQPEKGPVSQSGRAVGTGAYIGQLHTEAKTITELTPDMSSEEWSRLNESFSASHVSKFGYLRRK